MTTTIATPTPTSMLTHGLPFALYARFPAINWSTLKEMRRSPLHYWHRLKAPLADRLTLALGRLVHTAVLEPDRVPLDYAVFDGKRRQGKVWEAFRAANAHRTIVNVDEYARALAIRDAVRANPIAARYLANGAREVTITWVDPKTSLPCKARLDWLADIDGALYLVDLKSSADIDMRRFGSTAARLGYHCQLAWYLRALQAVGKKIAGSLIIAAESEAPHDVGVFTLDEDTLFAGDEECGELLESVARCHAGGSWPGRYAREEPLQLPAWWFAQADEAGLGVVIEGEG